MADATQGQTPVPCPTRCHRCGQRFSPDGRFCPFDGEPLSAETDWNPIGDPLLDRTVDGRYHIEAVIGEGGMGTVYRVRHVSLDKLFALKALRADLANDPDIARRFIHEARVIASVSHPGLVQISDFGQLPTGQAYFVMELLGGAPLRALIRNGGALAPSRARYIARKIAESISVAHAAGIVHRDLKPDNVHVIDTDAGEEVKIVDFGLAKVLGGSKLTREGIIFGTPHYISPEQAAGEAPDLRADIYALGIMLYEMLTGHVPFEADSYMGVLTQHIYMKPLPPSESVADAEKLGDLEAIVLRCLEKKPERRFSSMDELAAALQEPAGAQQGSPVEWSALAGARSPSWQDDASEPSSPARSITRRRTVPVLVALALFFGSGIAAAVVAWAFQSRSEPGSLPFVEGSAPPRPRAELPAMPVSDLRSPTAPERLTAEASQPVPNTAPSWTPGTLSAKPARPPLQPKRPKLQERVDIIDPWAKPAP